MKGKVYQHKQGYWFVAWYDKDAKKQYKVYRYLGEMMYQRPLAIRLLGIMQNDYEKGTFRIEKYLSNTSDVITILRDWLKEESSHLTPATIKDYENSIENHLVPWFERNPYSLDDLQYNILCKLMGEINRSGKGRLNVMYCLRRCFEYCKKSNLIVTIPTFPEKRLYNIIEPVVRWLPEERQMNVIEAIPAHHRPIFLWLKYHLRRPSEAMALYREDYKQDQDVFIIKRTFSNKKLIEQTKTKKQHIIPCHPKFKPIRDRLVVRLDSPFMFTNPTGRLDGKRYQHDFLVDLWNEACKRTGESIDMYSGLKHSSCSQYLNEKGRNMEELQLLTDHARRESLKKYVNVSVETKRKLMG